MADILITAEDEDGDRFWSDVYSDDYDIETTFKRARDDMVSTLARQTLTLRAYRIAEDPFASMLDEDGASVTLHNFEDVG